MDPFHVVALAGDKLNQTRQRVQRELTGGRGRRNDPLYKARRLLHTGVALLTDRQNIRLDALFSREDHAEVEVTWNVYQNIIAAYRETNRKAGRRALTKLIDSIKAGVPKGLSELAQLGRTLHKRRDDILAFFDHPGTSNGPTEAINGRLEHLRQTTNDENALRGLPASTGRATGTARVIRSPEEFHRLQPGDILVCPYTDPTWTPLFALAAAVVADTGGPLSHAAIVAREYGIPAVLGVGHATNLPEGATLLVDGTVGTVTIIDQS